MKAGQRDYMRHLFRTIGPDADGIVRAYADAESRKFVERKSNAHKLSPEQYARSLLLDGINKGWIGDGPLDAVQLDN